MDDGSISTLVSVLAYGVVYAGDDVVVPGGRYVLWGDNADYWSQPNFFEVFVNIVEFLLTCEVENECGVIECGTGVCGNACPNTCASNEICFENTCVCDVENECNGLECGIGVCGNTCSCDTENECVGRKCGIGICGTSKFPCIHTLFENCAQCDTTKCNVCFGGYYLKDGECFTAIEIGDTNVSNNVGFEGNDNFRELATFRTME